MPEPRKPRYWREEADDTGDGEGDGEDTQPQAPPTAPVSAPTDGPYEKADVKPKPIKAEALLAFSRVLEKAVRANPSFLPTAQALLGRWNWVWQRYNILMGEVVTPSDILGLELYTQRILLPTIGNTPPSTLQDKQGFGIFASNLDLAERYALGRPKPEAEIREGQTEPGFEHELPPLGERPPLTPPPAPTSGFVPYTDEEGKTHYMLPEAANRLIAARAEEMRFAEERRKQLEDWAQNERVAKQVEAYTPTWGSPDVNAGARFAAGMENLANIEGIRNRQNAWTQAYGGLNPAQISAKQVAAREPWTQMRQGNPLAAQFPQEWEDYAAPRTYQWAGGSSQASSFSPQEPFGMSFVDFLKRRANLSALSPSWAKPPREGEMRLEVPNWGFKQPWEGGPAPRGDFAPARSLPRYAEMRSALKRGF